MFDVGVNWPFNKVASHAPEMFGNRLFLRSSQSLAVLRTLMEFPCYDLRLGKAASVSFSRERSNSPGTGEIAPLIQRSCFMYRTLKK